ncbi:MAG: nitroreductase family protein, partial [Clostridia bacterium]|nr:nitroreductase family protein [Clostridia bacterium]
MQTNGGIKMEFEKLITERYSVRNFQPEHLPQETIDKILEAGHKAPTGCNYQ